MLIKLAGDCRLVPILGNHDEMMLKARESKAAFRDWMEFGGITTLDSYEASGVINVVPDSHFQFCSPAGLGSRPTHTYSSTPITIHTCRSISRTNERCDGCRCRTMCLDRTFQARSQWSVTRRSPKSSTWGT